MIEFALYFAGPKTLWSGRIADEEVIARRVVPWLWLARVLARRTHAGLDHARCGYVVLKDGEVVEHVEPDLPKPKPQNPDALTADGLAEILRQNNARIKADVLKNVRLH